ncbi:hypothetical protein KK062_15675 [Fulvivirgaceae bacterium PWU5]|uniref:histidine kinase n=1 Tax=Dawidia cretensis TaxID=2782350 RepID=A0AAP2E115_9BACT|nr:ATP-binding protein [Dawidia cretensis]MBT1709682.1 hypothetical protein [Dawidia cretensis]
MKLYVEKKVIGGFIITVSILISLGVYAHINNRALLSASRKVSHLDDVLYHLERTLVRAADRETGDKVTMDSIRQVVASMQYQQTQQLHQHEAEMSRRIWHTDVAFISLLGTTVLILAAVFGTLQVHLAGRTRAEENAGHLHRELEAFTYSVSHDLRAPLRSIHGYSQILQDEYGEKLDANGRRIANTVMKNAQKMGRLIDDLLDFSHVGRSTLHPGKVNMADLVNALLADNIDRKTHETLRVHVHTLPPVVADIGLIRQVWTNLISNAVKYSSKKEFPQVWINAFETGTEIVYSVRDNGVGFDMQYVHKLFGVFQRLHRDDEFEGTGVGLALVYRIVARHGGRAWAEAVPDQGATFFFALPRTVNPNDR